MPDEMLRFPAPNLHRFTVEVLGRLGVPEGDAVLVADGLVHADLMGIDSHGVARLGTHQSYVPGLRTGVVNPTARLRVVRETAVTAMLDGDSGLGIVAATRAMALAIHRAAESAVGMVSVANTHHLGIASHYAMMALPHDMIGVAMTNAAPQVAPTFGKKAMLGTNPLSIAAPAGRERPFILDIATSVGAAGKVEIALRAGKPIPDGWIVDAEGQPSHDPAVLWAGGALLPLGSFPELSSHKGYGLALAVDILCGILSGAGYSALLNVPGWPAGHFLAAIRIDAFRPVADFKAMMDEMIAALRAAPTVAGAERVLIPGERELATEEERRRLGIPLHPRVVASLESLGAELGVPLAPPG